MMREAKEFDGPETRSASLAPSTSTAPSIVGIVGLGSVGGPLASLVRRAGNRRLIGVDTDPDALARIDRRMKSESSESSESSVGNQDQYVLTDDPAALADADIIIEALPENIDAKVELLRYLDRLCSHRTVLVSASADISLLRLAVAGGRPDRTVGLRLLTPPRAGSVVEPVHTAMSGDEAHTDLDDLIVDCGLTPVEIGSRPAAYATALVHAYLNRAVNLIEQGYADHIAIDQALRLGCGLPLGPLAALDEAGLDSVHAALSEAHPAPGDDPSGPARLLTAMVDSGAVGRKSGQGFYRYEDSGAASSVHSTSQAPVGGDGDRPGPAVRRVGIVGSGTMARGVAEVFSLAGIPTVLTARSQQKAESAAEGVAASMAKAVRRGRISPDQRAAAQSLLEVGADWATLADCDLVVETVVEDPDAKRAVFERLGRTCQPGAVMASTTSSLSVAELAEASGRPADVLGLHFFNPAPVMRLVELARTDATGDSTVERATAFCQGLGKTVVPCRDRTGYIVNYLLFGYLADAIRLLDRPDVDIEELDDAITRGFGYPMGPFALLDTIGLDVSVAILRRLHSAFPGPVFEPPVLLEQLVAQDRLGRKTGHGFWRQQRPRAVLRLGD